MKEFGRLFEEGELDLDESSVLDQIRDFQRSVRELLASGAVRAEKECDDQGRLKTVKLVSAKGELVYFEDLEAARKIRESSSREYISPGSAE